MAFKVDVTLPTRPVGNVGVEFPVKEGDSMLGTLKVSKGRVIWKDKYDTYGYQVSWNKLAELIKKGGKKEGGSEEID